MSLLEAVDTLTDTKIDQLCIDTIRTLSIAAVQQAKSGHPPTRLRILNC
jgi:transketolase